MKTKVIMLGWEFPPHNSGGLGTACQGLSRALASRDIELTFVLPRKIDVKNPGVKFLFADDKKFAIKIRHIDSILTPYMNSTTYDEETKYMTAKRLYGHNLFEEVERYTKEAVLIGKEVDFDIIHAHDWMSFKAGLEMKRISGKPLVVHVHSTEVDRTGGSTNVNHDVYAIEKEVMEQADKVITVSEFTKKIIVDFYHISPEKICVVHNGINHTDYEAGGETAFFHHLKEQGNKVVLYVGRLTIQKGVDYFLTAAKRVLEYYPNAIFVIVGSGDMNYQIIRTVASLGISDKVFFAGFLRGKELNDMYRLADLFVMPSVSEPFGLTALEAVVHHTPVLVSKQSGVSEILSHALKVDFWDIEEMSDKILAVLSYDALHLSLKKNAYEQVKQANWQQAAQKCIDVYQQVLNSYFHA